ncbi:MAG: hypothetical protein ACRD96_20410, partial [Bryobacteraceae bacterium]
GRIEFASLRLADPVVNLVKTGGRWNFERLVSAPVVRRLPKIAVRGGRIHFKFDDTKAVFYVTNADLDLTQQSGWRIEFSGEPARTDRAARGLGRFRGEGVWESRERMRLDIELERGAIEELVALVYGRDVGVHGTVSSKVRLDGALDNLDVSGAVRVEGIHRWDQMPPAGMSWPLGVKGKLDAAAQRLELTAGGDVLPVMVRYRVSNYMSQPQWGVNVQWTKLPAEPLAAIARHMGAALPEGVRIEGTLDGALGFSSSGGMQGTIAATGGSVTVADRKPVRIEKAHVVVDGDRLELRPAEMETGARIEARYGWKTGEVEVALTSDGTSLGDLPLENAPLVGRMSKGEWRGRLRYDGAWSGNVALRGAEVVVDGLADPVQVESAVVKIDGARVAVEKLDAGIGTTRIEGEYRYEPGAARPHRFRLRVPRLQTAELERILAPSLERREGLIRRALGWGRAPEWLTGRHADGRIEIGELTAGEWTATNVTGRVVWDGVRVELRDVAAKALDGGVYGGLTANLGGQRPQYRMNFVVRSIDWAGGKADSEGSITATGMGLELMANLRVEGSFAGREMEFGELNGVKSVVGCYKVEAGRVRFTELRVETGDDLFVGRGATQADGRLVLELVSGEKRMRVIGTLAQVQ